MSGQNGIMESGRKVGRFVVAGAVMLALSGCGYSVPLYVQNRVPASYVPEVRAANAPAYRNAPVVNENPLPLKQVATTDNVSRSTDSSVTVAKGDTVYALSRRYNVPIRALIETNGLKPPFLLSTGQVLYLPRSAVHTVAKGDTIYSISRRYGVDMSSLARHNGIAWPYSIFPNQVLSLPGTIVSAKSAVVSPVKRSLTDSAKKTPLPNTEKAKKKDAKAQKTRQVTKSKTSKQSKVKNIPAQKRKNTRKSTVRLPDPPSRTKGKFAWPLKGKIVTRFGSAGAGRHNDGINIKVEEGTFVRAAENGVVAYAGNELKGFGNLLLIKHADGWMTAYAHNKEFLVKRGQTVKRGQAMAKAGKTGNVKEAQLHFEIRRGTKAVDPVAYLETR